MLHYFVLCSSQDNDQKFFSVPVPYNVCPRKLLDKNSWFISFYSRVKSSSVNKAAGTGLVITNIPLCFLQQPALFSVLSFVQGKSLRWKVLEGKGHKGAWSVRLWGVRTRELISLLLLTWCVTLGKPHFLCELRSSLPFTVCKMLLCWLNTLSYSFTVYQWTAGTYLLFSFISCLGCLYGMISCYCWYSPSRLKKVSFFVPLSCLLYLQTSYPVRNRSDLHDDLFLWAQCTP